MQWPAKPDLHAHDAGAEERDHVVIVRPGGEILFASRTLDQATDDIVGANVYDFLAEDQHEALASCLSDVFAGGGVRRVELSNLRLGAGGGSYDCRVSPNLRDGRVVSATIVAHSVTLYKEAVARLEADVAALRRALEERDAASAAAHEPAAAPTAALGQASPDVAARFRTLLDQAGDAVFVSDAATGTLVDLNETACRWLRAPREDLIGRRVDELGMSFSITIPEDADLQFTETRDTRRPIILENQVQRRSDGSTFPVEVAVARHRLVDGEFLLAVVRDVKGRQVARDEARLVADTYELLLDQSWDAVFVTGRGGEIERVNPAAVELFGYPKDEFQRLDAKKLFERSHDIRRFQAQMSAAGRVEDLEVRMLTKDGRAFAALLSARRRPTLSPGIRGYQCLVRPLEAARPTEAAPPSAPAELAEPASLAEAVEPQAAAPDRPAPAPRETRRETVLIAARGADLANARKALRSAGMRVLSADDAASAIETVRDEAGAITAVVYDIDLGDLDEALACFAESAPLAHVVIMGPAHQVPAGADGPAVLAKPVHPLSLVQHIRDR